MGEDATATGQILRNDPETLPEIVAIVHGDSAESGPSSGESIAAHQLGERDICTAFAAAKLEASSSCSFRILVHTQRHSAQISVNKGNPVSPLPERTHMRHEEVPHAS